MLMPSIFSDGFFDDFMRLPMERASYTRPTRDLMRTDIKEAEDHYELHVDLPGFQKEDMKLQLKDGYLTIQASRQDNKDEKDQKGKFVRRERYMGSVSRSFYVGENVHQEDIHAKYENGILQVTFPKQEPKKEVEENKFISIEG